MNKQTNNNNKNGLNKIERSFTNLYRKFDKKKIYYMKEKMVNNSLLINGAKWFSCFIILHFLMKPEIEVFIRNATKMSKCIN